MEDPKPTNKKTCSCGQKSDCPLNQNCLSEYLVYNAIVNTSTTKNYCGTSEKSFKERYDNHASLFRNKSRKTRKCRTRKSDLCLCEKFLIARANSASLINKRDELVSKCCHMNKFTLKCFKNRQNVILMIFFVSLCSFRCRYKKNIADHLVIG